MQVSHEKQAAAFLREIERFKHRMATITETLLEKEDVDLATSPKDLVFQQDSVRLYRYRPRKKKLAPVPLLITYALVNRETMMDLQEGRSLINNLLDLGIDIYLIVWGYPARMDRYVTLDDYIDLYMDECVDFVRAASGREAINLMGVCQGGTLTSIYTALHPGKVRNLVTMVTPIDFDTDDGLLNVWARYVDADLMVDALGNIPGDFMNFVFLMLKPYQLMMDKYVGFVESADNPGIIENFLRMEKWIFDSPDQAGEAFRTFVNELYKNNALIKGQLEIGGRRVSLGNIDMPVLNIYAELDHLVPPSSSKPLKDHVSSKDVTTVGFPVGHIGMYVSSKSQKTLAPTIGNWLLERMGVRRPAAQKKPSAEKPVAKKGSAAGRTGAGGRGKKKKAAQ